MRPATTAKRPSITMADIMRRQRTMPTQRGGTQLTPDITVRRPRKLTPRSTARNSTGGRTTESFEYWISRSSSLLARHLVLAKVHVVFTTILAA
jgi:hypothetical protein